MENRIFSKIILDAKPTIETEKNLKKNFSPKKINRFSLCVFEVRVNGMVRYCCWSGGKMDPESPRLPLLTTIGHAAMEALVSLPFLHGGTREINLVFQELRIGKTPLQEKIIMAFEFTKNIPSVICFVGDLSRELDGKMVNAFNLCGSILIADCAGIYIKKEI